jgi:hypothetical protein
MRRCKYQHGWIYRPRRSSRHLDLRINDLDFADDNVLLANSIREACDQLEDLRVEAAEVGLMINEKKTEYMAFNCVKTEKVMLKQRTKTGRRLQQRCGQTWSAFKQLEKIWKARSIPLDLKMRILDSSVISILLGSSMDVSHGSLMQSWRRRSTPSVLTAIEQFSASPDSIEQTAR